MYSQHKIEKLKETDKFYEKIIYITYFHSSISQYYGACTQDKTDSAVENGSIEEPTAKMKMKN